MKCIIVGASELFGDICPGTDDVLIAADGGYDRLIASGLTPDLCIGDLDSVGKIPSDVPVKRFPVRKNETDMHLCYLEGRAMGYRSFLIYGGTGGRVDHTFANLQLLLYMARQGDIGVLIGDGYFSFVISEGECVLDLPQGVSVSVFAFGGDARDVNIKGLSYEGEALTLTPDFPLGVSNSSLGGEGRISVGEGSLLITVGTGYRKELLNIKK